MSLFKGRFYRDRISELENEVKKIKETLGNYKQRNEQLERDNEELEKVTRERDWIKRLLNDDDVVLELFDAVEKAQKMPSNEEVERVTDEFNQKTDMLVRINRAIEEQKTKLDDKNKYLAEVPVSKSVWNNCRPSSGDHHDQLIELFKDFFNLSNSFSSDMFCYLDHSATTDGIRRKLSKFDIDLMQLSERLEDIETKIQEKKKRKMDYERDRALDGLGSNLDYNRSMLAAQAGIGAMDQNSCIERRSGLMDCRNNTLLGLYYGETF